MRPVLLLVSAAAAILCPRLAAALPDLTPRIYEVEIDSGQTVSAGELADGCAGAMADRTLVRFGVDTDNVGPDPLVIGDPGCPDCSANPGAACANADFQCSLSGNPRPVFVSSARYELLDIAGNLVALGVKRNY